MAVDYFSETDNKFFADNLLSKEDWDMDTFDTTDLNFLDLEANNLVNFDPDEFIQNIGGQLQDHGLDLGSVLNSNDLPMTCDGLDPEHHSDTNSDSGISSLSIKQEPLSPSSSHCSDNSNDSAYYSQKTCSDTLRLETPPQTPPAQLDIYSQQPTSKHTAANNIVYNLTNDLLNGVTIKTENLNLPPHVVSVINSKVKIQPKLPSPIVTQQSLSKPQLANTNKPLVLSAEEFAKLTSQGLLKFNNPGGATGQAANQGAHVPMATSTNIPNTNVKLIKRQQRMIKNRESACLSRKRKKDYMTSIEVRLQECTDKNNQLIQENETLRQRVQHLEQENALLKKVGGISGMSKKTATATVLLTVLLLLGLNISSFSILPQRNRQADNIKTIGLPNTFVRRGRTLLSINDNRDDVNVDAQFSQVYSPTEFRKAVQNLKTNFQSFDDLTQKGGDALSNARALTLLKHLEAFTSCPNYFNKTESQRLANELTGWVLGHKQVNRKETEKAAQKIKKKHRPFIRKLKTSTELGVHSRNKYQVQVFQSQDRGYYDFLDSIHRRNDTYYVVSFRRDYLLLPALAHNKTMRPRMSLLMPAVTLNESMQPPDNHAAMMQIDCEVIDTKLLHIKKSAIPSFAQENNVTSGTDPANVVMKEYDFHRMSQHQGAPRKAGNSARRKST